MTTGYLSFDAGHLVPGGLGFIDSHRVRQLVDIGADLLVVDRLHRDRVTVLAHDVPSAELEPRT